MLSDGAEQGRGQCLTETEDSGGILPPGWWQCGRERLWGASHNQEGIGIQLRRCWQQLQSSAEGSDSATWCARSVGAESSLSLEIGDDVGDNVATVVIVLRSSSCMWSEEGQRELPNSKSLQQSWWHSGRVRQSRRPSWDLARSRLEIWWRIYSLAVYALDVPSWCQVEVKCLSRAYRHY